MRQRVRDQSQARAVRQNSERSLGACAVERGRNASQWGGFTLSSGHELTSKSGMFSTRYRRGLECVGLDHVFEIHLPTIVLACFTVYMNIGTL